MVSSSSCSSRNVSRLFVLLCLAALPLLSSAHGIKTDDETELKPNGRGSGEVDTSEGAHVRNQAARVKSGANGITYHNGPVMTAAANVYLIWYGNWTAYATAQTSIPKLINGFSGSPIYNINTTYYNASNVKVPNSVLLAGQTSDSYSNGTALSDAGVLAVVNRAITGGWLPKDTNGVYFVLTSPDVTETSGFGSVYCGWHTYGTVTGSTIKYSFVGNPLKIAPAGCGVNTPSPNGNDGADAMASIIYHELSETVSDPQLNAWYDSRGYENGDKCAWTFGTTYKSANGGTANVKLGGLDWLIQQNWVNASGGKCALSF
jgi:hypothetical protein